MRKALALCAIAALAGCGDDTTGTDGNQTQDLASAGDLAKGAGDLAGGGGDMSMSAGDMSMAAGDMSMMSNVDLAGVMINCATYCTAVQANCTAGNADYATNDACNLTCMTASKWPMGAFGDGMNTLGCREEFALAAAADPAANCAAAGISGDNACGTWCNNYCYLALKNCTGNNSLFNDMNSCLAACANIPSDPTMPNAQTGNTLQCRIYHLNNAGGSQQLANTHCPHGSPTPTGPCT